MGRTFREAAAALREANALDVLADSVERLTLGAGDPPDEACVAMAQSLLTPGVASRIAAYLGNQRDEERRKELVRVCKLLGHDMALAICDALSGTPDRFARRTFLDTMVEIGPDAMPIVEQMVEDSRWFVVRNALAILGEVGGERPVELIISTLAHTDARVRREALLALAKVGGEDAGMLVYGMIEDSDPDVRLAAAMAAGELKVERALRPLLALLEGENDSDVVVGVLRALGQLGDPGAVNAIEKRAVGSFFSKPPADVRIAAYRALHNIGTPHAKSLLVQAADDKDPAVKGAVRQLLGMR
jgi:HEAT repeat protein